MRKSAVLAAVAAVVGGGLIAAGSGSATSPPREYVVLYETDASLAAAQHAVEAAGGELLRVNGKVGVATARSASADFAQDATAARAIRGVAMNRSIGRAPAARRAKADRVERDGWATGAPARSGERAVAAGGDPLSGQQWDMRVIGATPDGSYAVQPGTREVRVGIIDTGIDGNHPDIAPNFNGALSRNFTVDIPLVDGPCEDDPDGSCTDPPDVDEQGHGTHVASTVGSPVNGIGMSGVAPGIELVNLRAAQDSGYFFLQGSVDALTYAGDNGIDVVNMSYFIDPWLFNCAANPADSAEEQAEQRTIVEAAQRALDYARAHGVTLVSSEGNGATDLGNPVFDDSSPNYPGGTERERNIDNSCTKMPTEGAGVIGVTSVGPTGRKAYYSDYGVEQADVSAPGGDSRSYYGTPNFLVPENVILAAYPESLGRAAGDIDEDGNPTTPFVTRSCADGRCAYYRSIQGTSMASPHAAGVAALIVAARGTPDPVHGGKTLSPETVESVLRSTATDTPCPEPREYTYDFDTAGTYTATCEGPPARNGFFGDGLVNALAAGTPPPPPPAPPAATPAPAAPAPPAAAPPVKRAVVVPKLTVGYHARLTTTRLRRLALVGEPGAKVGVSCKGGGCPRGVARLEVAKNGRRNILPLFKGRSLRPGARITIRIAVAGEPTRTFVVRIRRGLPPAVTDSVI